MQREVDYSIEIKRRYRDLKKTGKKEFDHNDLWKIFEYYTCITLTEKYGTPFYEYNDISIYFKEEHNLTKNDCGIDCCNLIDTIVQAKLRKHITFENCSTFFCWQNVYDEKTEQTIVKWPKMILSRPIGSTRSKVLTLRQSIYIDHLISEQKMLKYCEKLLLEKDVEEEKPTYVVRDYQQECIDFVRTSYNGILNLPTGTGKNFILIKSLYKNEKYLILVPRIVIMDQIKDEIIEMRPGLKNDILTMGDKTSNYDPNYNIIICVYNSVLNITDFSVFYQIFIDEAHNIKRPYIYTDDCDEEEKPNTYKQKILSLSQYDNNIYMSATIDKNNDFEYFYRDIRTMIDKGYLVDYQIHIPIFTDLVNDFSVCEYLIKNYRSIIIYCSNRSHGLQVCQFMNDIMPGSTEYIDCKVLRKERKRIIAEFKTGKTAFLVNVRVLTEGFNAPITNGVCFLHMPSNTKTEIQILGRALRLHKNKSIAHIIMPYVDNSDISSINVFLRELSENDIAIKNSIKNKDTGMRIFVEKIGYVDDPSDNIILDHKYDLIYDSFNKMINRNDVWFYRLEELKTYIDKHGCKPKRTDSDRNVKSLARWLHRQIQNYKNKSYIMKEEQIHDTFTQFLTEYNDYFIDNNTIWKKKLLKIKTYIDENGYRPNIYSKNKDIKKLGQWILNQINNYKKKIHIMKEEQIHDTFTQFLTEYNDYFIDNNIIWKKKLLKIKTYIDENGYRPSKCNKIKNIKILGSWLSTQIQQYKKKIHIMNETDIYNEFTQFLTEYNDYFIDNNTIWKKKLLKIKTCIDENGYRPNIYSEDKDIKKLGIWLSHQIQQYKKKTNIMNEKDIYNEFTQFLIEYDKYFKTKII